MRFSRLSAALCASALLGQTPIPDWCRKLPRPEYKTLTRVPITDPWFEVYRIAPAVFALYEPHQSEEIISYLIVGSKQALLFDTGMGISDIKKLTAELTQLPVIVLNSHTHLDHVGGNWQFNNIYGLDTEFSRLNARGSRQGAQDEIAPSEICGSLPAGFDRAAYSTRPWTVIQTRRGGDRIDLGGRILEILSTPGHTPDAISLLDRQNGLLFTGDSFYAGTLWLYRPETDLAAYGASIRRLAELASQLKSVHGAHNVPVAPPSILPRVAKAFAAVRSGSVKPEPKSAGQVVYTFDGIRFLMASPSH